MIAAALPQPPNLPAAPPPAVWADLDRPAPAPPPDTPQPDPQPDPRLMARIGLGFALRHQIMPLWQTGAVTFLACADAARFAQLRPELESRLGRVALALTSAEDIARALLNHHGPALAHCAETQLEAAASCRGWGGPRVVALALLALCVILLGLIHQPVLLGLLGLCLALLALVALTGLKVFCAFASLRPPRRIVAGNIHPGPLPMISLIIGLYHESDIATRLIKRLNRLDYPRHKLEVILAVEAEDLLTQTALQAAQLPDWMRIILVPKGQIKTKPRALNLALMQSRGQIIGIYDAEDAPNPQQLHAVARGFQSHGPQVACLQGRLDYYNPQTNWIARCFTLEYAAWFRLYLPGLARLGLPVPLGGTTLFFRRDILERLGAWDAHNVTEDADLGLRLARHGYRTEMLDSTTHEEANCLPRAWIKQRSRWIKGYMITWIILMRKPRQLWQELGAKGFIACQVMFLGAIMQSLLAPMLWSFWLLALARSHPLTAHLPAPLIAAMLALFILSAAIDMVLWLKALKLSGQNLSRIWVFTQHFYHPLATFAAYKALWELIWQPFYWDKTAHGLFDPLLPETGAKPAEPA